MVTTSDGDARVRGVPDPTPPTGYENWLEYAVAMFDARKVLGPAFDDVDRALQRQVQIGVWADFNALRKRAGLPAIEPKGLVLSFAQPIVTAHSGPRENEGGTAASISQDSAQNDPRSLLDLMDAMPQYDGIDFDPVVIRAEKVDPEAER